MSDQNHPQTLRVPCILDLFFCNVRLVSETSFSLYYLHLQRYNTLYTLSDIIIKRIYKYIYSKGLKAFFDFFHPSFNLTFLIHLTFFKSIHLSLDNSQLFLTLRKTCHSNFFYIQIFLSSSDRIFVYSLNILHSRSPNPYKL